MEEKGARHQCRGAALPQVTVDLRRELDGVEGTAGAGEEEVVKAGEEEVVKAREGAAGAGEEEVVGGGEGARAAGLGKELGRPAASG